MKAISINAWEIENNDGETLVFMTPQDFDFIKKNKEKMEKEIERLNNIRNKAIDKIKYIIDYGFDYDGFEEEKDLKGLIDMLVKYAVESKNILKGEDKE